MIIILQPFSLSSTPPKWLAELEKDDMDMLQGTVNGHSFETEPSLRVLSNFTYWLFIL